MKLSYKPRLNAAGVLCQRRAIFPGRRRVVANLAGCASAVCVNAAEACMRSIAPPFPMEAAASSGALSHTWPATGKKQAAAFNAAAALCQRRAIFPGRRQPSIVATDELNFRVRNGNGWTLIVIGTDFQCVLHTEN